MQFPTTEEGILDLAEKMAEGFEKHPDVFPNPPFPPKVLKEKIKKCRQGQEESADAHTAAVKARQKKMGTLQILPLL